MTRNILCLLSYLFLTASASAFDPANVQWDGVQSKARWLNFYNEPVFLTLKIDGFEAFKKVASGRHFALTLFPPGEYQSQIVNSYDKKVLERFSLKVENSKIYTFISLGSPEKPCRTWIVADNPTISIKGESHIRVVNAFTDKTILWSVDQPGKNPALFEANISPMDKGETSIVTKSGFSSTVQIPGEGKSNSIKLSLRLPTGEADSNWVIIVFPDPDHSSTARFGYYQEGNHPFLLE